VRLDSVLTTVTRDLGVPSVLVHNAVGGAWGSFQEIDPKSLNANFQVNTMVLLHLARWAAPAMIAAGKGQLSSLATTPSNVEIGHLQRVPHDEFPPWLHNVAHQGREHLRRVLDIAHPDLQ
jgi:hypothetical protein